MTLFPDAKYFLAEPLPDRRAELEELSRSHPNVDVFHGAIGAAAGTMVINVHNDQSSLLTSTTFPAERTVEIEVQTLDHFLANGRIQSPDFLKADVQGYELEALAGAVRAVESIEMIQLEVSYRRLYTNAPLAHEVIGRLGEMGFRIFDICTYVQRAVDHRLLQSDILFAKNDSNVFANESWFA